MSRKPRMVRMLLLLLHQAHTVLLYLFAVGVVNMILTFRGCSGIENLECVPPTTVQEGLETDLQAAGIDLSILSMTGSVCYCGNVACNMVPDSLLQGEFNATYRDVVFLTTMSKLFASAAVLNCSKQLLSFVA